MVRSGTLHFGGPGSWVWIPGMDIHTPLVKPCCGGDPRTKWRRIGTDVSSGLLFLKPKEKRGKLETNASAGQIFLSKKKKENKKIYTLTRLATV